MKNVNGKVNALAMAIIAGGTAIATGAPAVAQGIDFGIWGNNGGSSSANLDANSVNWFSTSAHDGKSAWENFRRFSGLDSGWLDQELAELPGFNKTTCENSKTIWYTVINDKDKGGYFWVNSISGKDKRTILVNGSGNIDGKAAHATIGVNGTVLDPALTYGTKPTQAQADALVKKYGKAELEKQAWTLVCSGSLLEPAPAGEKWIEYKAADPNDKTKRAVDDPKTTGGDHTPFNESYTRKREEAFETTRETGKVKDFTETITVNLEATPDIDPGDLPLTYQAKSHTTQFGELYKDALAKKLDGKSIAEVEKLVEERKTADKTAEYTMDLDDPNKKAIAEGGVMSINQFNQGGTITVRETETTIEKRQCTKSYVVEDEQWVEKVTCDPWENEKVGTGSNVGGEKTTQQNVGYWQLLVVQCNPEEFTKVKNALGSDVVSSEVIDQGNGVAGVIKTIMYTDPDTTKKKLANEKEANADLRRTAEMGFYDKECGLQCYSTKKNEDGSETKVVPKALPDASLVEDNGQGAGVKVSDDAKFDGKNLTIFRDNNPNRTITINVWKPEISANAVVKTTTLFRDPEGTPGAEGSAGEFVMTDKNGKNVFDQKDAEGKNIIEQKAWNFELDDKTGKPKIKDETFKSKNVSVLEGAHNVFGVRANWPSEVGKPQKLNIAWAYDVTGKATIPATVGVSNSATIPVAKNPQEQKANIEGRCFAMFNSNKELEDAIDNKKNLPDSSYLNANTGSGKSNAFNNPFSSVVNETNKDLYDLYNIVIDFVRTSAE